MIIERASDQLRTVTITPGFVPAADGSALIRCGDTQVICAASISDTVPQWMAGKGRGWVTAEYSMLPYSTSPRSRREGVPPSGRSQEIKRLIGRSLRAAVDLDGLREHLVTVDCDVLQADGGTRTASITGGYVALALALHAAGLAGDALRAQVAAVSVGIVAGQSTLDLCYTQDSVAEVDLNVVMNAEGQYIEVQGTAERQAFDHQSLLHMLALAQAGIATLHDHQRTALQSA